MGTFEAAVAQYKYTSPTLSLLERLYLNEFWTRVAEWYPRWLAPNLITLSGYVCVWAAFAVTLRGSPTLRGELEPWQYALNGALFFLYQTLDGSDGKQARRTGSGSALGELMDHGVDAVVTTFLALIVADVFCFGISSMWPWTFVIVALVSFFLSNMTLVHSGRQMFFDLDVMEIQTTMISALFITAAFGTEVFDQFSFPLPEALHGIKTDFGGVLKPGEEIDFTNGRLSLKLFVVLGGLFGCFFNYPQYIWASAKPYVWLRKEDQPEHIKRKVPGSGGLSLFSHLVLIHVFLVIACACVAFGTSISDKVRSESAMRAFAIIIAFSFGDIMNRVLLMRVAHVPLPLVPPGMAPLAAFSVLAWKDDQVRGMEPTGLGFHWWHFLALSAFLIHSAFFTGSVMRLARALNIHPFLIRKKAESKSS